MMNAIEWPRSVYGVIFAPLFVIAWESDIWEGLEQSFIGSKHEQCRAGYAKASTAEYINGFNKHWREHFLPIFAR